MLGELMDSDGFACYHLVEFCELTHDDLSTITRSEDFTYHSLVDVMFLQIYIYK
jgi:hypothetical protein